MYAEVVFPIPVSRVFHYKFADNVAARIRRGVRVVTPFKTKDKVGYVNNIIDKTEIADAEIKYIKDVYSPELYLTEELLQLGEWLSKRYVCTLGEAYNAILPVNIRAPKRIASIKNVCQQPSIASQSPITIDQLTGEQKNAVETIFSSTTHNVYLLFGVTASGKTQVYFHCIHRMLSAGKDVIYLLPEISLTPQFVSRAIEYFGKDIIRVWHSRLSLSERYETYHGILEGKVKILIGARSALFAPFKNLGLIIIDEEHEFTYKQDQRPYYHARDTAIERARINNAKVILGSATPSIESYYNALSGKYVLLRLRERFAQRNYAKIHVIDMRNLSPKSTMCEELKNDIKKCIEGKQQVLLFINRRGFSTYIHCNKCGWTAQCINCRISLVYHRDADKLICHLCSYEEKVPISCPRCGKFKLYFGGTGTERVESEIKSLYPYVRVQRVDLDTITSRYAYEKIYKDILEKKIDVLIGTQMIGKGFDFPNITLVGIINADTMLNLPDFRAAERTFQMIVQVSGRTGRGALGGKVYLQTYNPKSYVITTAIEYDYEKFYEQEIQLRKILNYPPFVYFARIIFVGKDEKRVKSVSEKYAKDLHTTLSILGLEKRITLVGPLAAAYSYVRKKYRWQMLIKGDAKDIEHLFSHIYTGPMIKNVRLIIDVDPVDIL
jgi:primosomal protein N' (replication factor Y)